MNCSERSNRHTHRSHVILTLVRKVSLRYGLEMNAAKTEMDGRWINAGKRDTKTFKGKINICSEKTDRG